MSENDYILEGRALVKSFGRGPARVTVLHGLDLAVRAGQFLAIMGPSGCGKSTLLHVLGLMTPTDLDPQAGARLGTVHIRGRAVGSGQGERTGSWLDPIGARTWRDQVERTRIRREDIGFVFQRFNLLGQLSAFDNVAISLKIRGMKAGRRVDELFETMGVSHVKRRKPGQMSIGEQQRVAAVRALAHGPAILLADEPTGNLDSQNSASLLELFQQLNRNEAQTIVMITHSDQAAGYADRIVHMKDGRLVDQGN